MGRCLGPFMFIAQLFINLHFISRVIHDDYLWGVFKFHVLHVGMKEATDTPLRLWEVKVVEMFLKSRNQQLLKMILFLF